MIKNVRWNELIQIDYEHTRFVRDETDPHEASEMLIDIHYKIRQQSWSPLLKIYPLDEIGDIKTAVLRFLGHSASCSVASSVYPPVFFFEQSSKQSVITAIHTQIEAIFGTRTKYGLTSYLSEDEDDFILKPMNFKETNLTFPSMIEAKRLDDYFMMVPEQELTKLDASELNGKFSPDSKLYNSQTLIIYCTFSLTIEILNNFKGKRACLKNAKCNDIDIIQFLKKWKLNQEPKKLEIIEIEFSYNDVLNPDRIKLNADLKSFPSSMELPIFEDTTRSFGTCRHIHFPETMISSYIVRNDGIIAFIWITSNFFLLQCKDFTEEQMMSRLQTNLIN